MKCIKKLLRQIINGKNTKVHWSLDKYTIKSELNKELKSLNYNEGYSINDCHHIKTINLDPQQ